MPSILLYPAGQIVNPDNPQRDLAVGANFERFDGLDIPDTNPASGQPDDSTGLIAAPMPGYPRPGQLATPTDEQTYTPGPLRGVVGTVGGQPLPIADAIHRQPGAATPAITPSIQWRLGVGQAGPSALGAAQTVQLSEITANPPVPGDLTSIISGQG